MKPIALFGAVATVALASALCLIAPPPPFLPVLVHRGLHLLGMVLLLGNSISGAAWLAQADASKSLTQLHFSLKSINRLDVWMTAPAAVLIVVNGAALAVLHGGVLKPRWLQLGVGLFVGAGLLWGAVLVPMQIGLEKACRQALLHGDSTPPALLRRRLVRYFVSGGVVGTLLIAALWVMVLKPL